MVCHMKFIVNLSGDFLFPFQAAIDIAEQLSSNLVKQFAMLAISPICELNSVNDWINLESLGKPVALRAESLVDRLKVLFNKNNITSIELHIYTVNNYLTADNEYILLFLSKLPIKLDILFFEASTVANRNALWKEIGFQFDNLNNINILIPYAWMCLKSGADELGCLLIERVLSVIKPTEKDFEQLFMQLQLIRFLAHRYLQVTNTNFPEQFIHLDKEEINHLYFIKAYSATLCRNTSIADIFFKKCEINSKSSMTDEKSLYRLNIYALFLVLQGKLEEALELEVKIQNYIKENQIDVVGLKYVNFINIARLYKKLKNFDHSLLYYEKAYEEIRDAYTVSDYIYYHINLGGLHEAAGDFEKAINHWIRALIFWQSAKNPLSLSWRPRLILCQEKITDILSPLSVEKVNQFFYQKINYLFSKSNINNFSNNTFDLSAIINNNIKENKISLSNNIISIDTVHDGLVLKYKRSFLNKKLSDPAEINLVKKLNIEKILQLDKLLDFNNEIFSTLIEKKVISYV
jgi:tetratricopeptide (TPR) repeat protein